MQSQVEPTGGRSDGALVKDVGRGDEAALRTLFDRHYGRVYAFAMSRLGDPSKAEEVTGDVFFEVWRGADQFRGDSRVLTWILGITHFKCLNSLRHDRAKSRAAVVASKVEYLHAVPDGRDPDAEIGSRAELRRTLDAIENLPEAHRRVVRMALIEGLSHAEIAERLGLDPSTVKTRVSRARARLRRQMGGGR